MDTSALPPEVVQAETVLGCRHGITRSEVPAAYRRAVKRDRPDLGGVDGGWTVRVQAARDLLLACAPADRRRRSRSDAGPGSSYRLMRRSVWGAAGVPDERIDVRL